MSVPIDMMAGGAILLGIAGLLLHRKLPPRFATTIFVIGTSLGLGMIAYRHHWPAIDNLAGVSLLLSLLSALWAAMALYRAYQEQSAIAKAGRSLHPHENADRSSEMFRAWSLVFAVGSAAVCGYLLLIFTGSRIITPNYPVLSLSPFGLLAIAGMLIALLAGGNSSSAVQKASHEEVDEGAYRASLDVARHQPALLLVLIGMAVWWTSLMIPSIPIYGELPKHLLLFWQPSWWTWSLHLQMGLALLLAAAAILQDLRYRNRRKKAWPDRLDDLIQPYARWPGYIQTESILAAVILVLGVYQLVRDSRPGWSLQAANSLACVIGGVTCLYMTYRRWSPNTAGLGMALVTLSCVAAAGALATPFMPDSETIEYVVHVPVLFNAVLLALWIMIALWSWLTRFWDQQLLEGSPWTMAGRMIPYARRTAFLLSVLAVIVAFQMTIWPTRQLSLTEDNSLSRMIIGAITIVLLAVQSTFEARRRDSTPVAMLAVAFYLAAIAFIFIRLPSSPLRGRLIQYDAVVMSALALPIIVAAEALRAGRWRCFSIPLWFLSLFILPLRAVLELLAPHRLPTQWIQPITLAILGGLYSFAGRRAPRRAFLVLGIMFLLGSIGALFRLYQS